MRCISTVISFDFAQNTTSSSRQGTEPVNTSQMTSSMVDYINTATQTNKFKEHMATQTQLCVSRDFEPDLP